MLAATCNQQQELTALNTRDFGFSVAVSVDMAIVGDPLMTIGTNTSQGAVWVFARSDGTEVQGSFGVGMALEGNTALVGGFSQGDDAVYVYVK